MLPPNIRVWLFLAVIIPVWSWGQPEIPALPDREIVCQFRDQADSHIQGIARGPQELFWVFTKTIVKTDLSGKVLQRIDSPWHSGAPCYVDGSLYVPVNSGKWNNPTGEQSMAYEYDAGNLELRHKHPLPEVVHGSGGIAFHNDQFYVAGGLPKDWDRNFIYVYDRAFRFIACHTVESGYTYAGVQTIHCMQGLWWLACYGKKILLCDDKMALQHTLEANYPYGMIAGTAGKIYVVRHLKSGSENGAKLQPMQWDRDCLTLKNLPLPE